MNRVKPVIAVVGAGSIVWGRSMVVDVFCNEDLRDAEIRLIDVSEERLALILEWIEFARRHMGLNHRVSAHVDLTEGLRGVTGCLTAISVGGDRLWRYDAMHPQLDGIFQSVGDTTGPGGAVRALRHAPALRRIATELARVGQPGAVLIQLTNPLNALTASLGDIPGIRVFGFCHGYHDTQQVIGKTLGLVRADAPVDDKTNPVRVELAGNNHFVFVDKMSIGERFYSQAEIGTLVPQIFDTTFREAIWHRYGVLVGNDSRHPIEFLPGFLTRRWDWGKAWGVEPIAGEIDPLRGERHSVRAESLKRDLEAARADATAAASWPLSHSREPVAEILAAFHTGARLDVHLNLPNEDSIKGISPGHHVELFCRIENGEVFRPKVAFPEGITGEIERIGRCQSMLAACCRKFDEDLLVEALLLDALMPKDAGQIRSLMREMIEFQRGYIFPDQA